VPQAASRPPLKGGATFAELKVTLPGARLTLRSCRAGCDPDRLSFLHAVRIVRRHLPFHAAFSPSAAPPQHDLVLVELIAMPAERSRGRHNPRVVKRKMSNFPTKAPAAPGSPPCRRFHYGDHVRIVAPAVAEIEPAVAAPNRRRACQARADRHALWLAHVRAWQASR
jgi:hypothetical protein